MESLRIIFMGTPEFAVPSLEILLTNGYRVVAVITAPDKPRGRGQKPAASPVKKCAQKHHLPLLQPTNLKSPAFVEELKQYRANLQVVVAFRMLPQVVWDMPEYGTFNLHASFLPKYRGAAPVHWAIINGETETGLTTFFIRQEIDTGNIILREKEPIYQSDTTGTLSERLMIKGADLVLKTVQLIESGDYRLIPQDLSQPVPKAPKLSKENSRIDWNQKSVDIINFIRGLNPFPSAWCQLNGTVYKIHQAEPAEVKISGNPGDYFIEGGKRLYLKTGDGAISIKELQAPGKRKMAIEDFLRGNQI